MEFELLGRKFNVSDGQRNYIKIFNYYNDMANRAIKGFNADVANKLKENYNENALNFYYDKYVTETRKYLSQFGVYTLSESEIWEGFVSDRRGRTELMIECDKAEVEIGEDIPDELESTDERTWYFLKTWITMFNSGYFNTAIRIDIMSLCDFATEYLSENKYIDITPIYAGESQKAEAIYENLLSGNIPFSERENLVFSLIEMDYSEEKYYRYIFGNYPQAKFEIAEITKYLGFDISDIIENDLKNTYDFKSLKNEEDALKMMSDLKTTLEKYGMSDSPVKRELNKILVEYDIKARTYDGEVYATRILRAQAEKDDLALVELVGKVCQKSKPECNELISQIKNDQYTPKIAQKHIEKLKARIRTIDKENLEKIVSDISSKNEEECNAIKNDIVAYDTTEKIKEPFVLQVEKRICDIWEEEDFNEFSNLFLQTRVSDYFNINKNIEYIREKGRTETKEKFVNAFVKLNDEDVTSAAKYVMSKDGGFFSSIFNAGKKETYEILTLNERVIHPAINDAISRIRAEKEANKGKGLFGAFSKIKAEVQNVTTNTPIAQAKNTTGGFKFCTECGTKISEDAIFCSKCGAKQE